MATVEDLRLLTIEEYAELPDTGRPTELVRGKVVEMNLPIPRHGEICSEVVLSVGAYARQHGLGRVVSNDAGVVTERNPDTLRGPDVAYYSYDRVPRGPLPRRGYLDVKPELAFEVRSSGDSWAEIWAKAGEFLNGGVQLVCVLDDDSRTARLYSADQPERVLQSDEVLTFPGILEGFSVRVGTLFE
ncbi:MAG: Uma2 family endonuclease [Planctomycetes bacterium]|nr:Uma2 family endonuclease [Planctomycetota bacterium]